jgi:TonB family protein
MRRRPIGRSRLAVALSAALLAACAASTPRGGATASAAEPAPIPRDSAALARVVDAELRRLPRNMPAAERARQRARFAELRAAGPWIPYYSFETDKPARGAPDSPQPQYPAALRDAGVQGEVMAEFVVGADGLADPLTLKVLSSPNKLFTDAVRAALPSMRFVPAEAQGRAVRTVVQQAFAFALR